MCGARACVPFFIAVVCMFVVVITPPVRKNGYFSRANEGNKI